MGINLLWKINRISSMNIKEIIYRITVFFRLNFLKPKKSYGIIERNADSMIYFLKNREILKNNDNNILSEKYIYKFYGANIDIRNIDWNKDYVDNYIYPQKHLCKLSMHKYASREVKNILELHRLNYLCEYALKFYYSKKNEDYLIVIECLKSWLNNNPFPYGMGWVSPTIAGKRIVSFLFIWNFLKLNNNDKELNLRRQITRSIEEHVYYIYNFLSLYSSGNNHLTAELVSIFIALKSLDGFLTKKGCDLKKKCVVKLEKLIKEQNYSDGKNKESSFGYQYQVTDWFFLAIYVDIQIPQILLSEDYNIQLKNMFTFFSDSFDNYNNFYDYGDRDNFHVFPFPVESQKDAFVQMLLSGVIFYKDGNLQNTAYNKYSCRNQILFGDFCVENGKNHKKSTNYYKEAGHIITRFVDNKGHEIYFNFKSGDFGYLSIAAHSHSDLNSFYLSVDGKPIFVDPGTYCYRKEFNFREYFRSSLAHNTVSINQQNHIVSYGYNHWKNTKKNFGKILDYYDDEKKIVFKSECVFPDKSVHYREIHIFKDNFLLKIIDTIEGRNIENAYLIFHLNPDISYKDGIIKGNKILKLKINSSSSLTSAFGQKEPFLLGWNSPEFSVIRPSQTLIGDFCNKREVETTIQIVG